MPSFRRSARKWRLPWPGRTRSGAIVATTDQDCADQLERSPGALGTLSLGQILAEQRDLKPLGLAGSIPAWKPLPRGATRTPRRSG